MGVDALLVLLQVPKRRSLGQIAAHLYGAMDSARVQVEKGPGSSADGSGRVSRSVPEEVSAAFEAARRRDREGRLLDRLFPSRRHRAWEPVGAWLAGVGRDLMAAEGPWHKALTHCPGGMVARSPGGVVLVFGICEDAEGERAAALLFDWLTFSRCEAGPTEVGRVVATVAEHIGAIAGAGGAGDAWDGRVRAWVEQAASSGAVLVAGRDRVPGFAEHVVRANSAVIGWRTLPPVPAEATEVQEEPDHHPDFTARWTGCSGRFVTGRDGQDEARKHYEKHVQVQREWRVEEIPNAAAYVESAARALDAVGAGIVELWQPANSAVVKYDPTGDVLTIGDLHEGDLRTHFRPGGSDYVLRKLQTGQWVPPPVLGGLSYDTAQEDEALASLFGELERAVSEADAEARAAAAGDKGRLIAAVASQERTEFLRSRVRAQYLMPADEAKLDAIERSLAEAQAVLDVAMEVLGDGAWTRAVGEAVAQYFQMLPTAVAEGNSDEIADLLIVRDRIEFARMASRARGPWAGLTETNTFREAELVVHDALIVVCGHCIDESAPPGGWPETFVWRLKGRAGRSVGDIGAEV